MTEALIEPKAIDVLIERLTENYKEMLSDRSSNPESFDVWDKGFMRGLYDTLSFAVYYRDRYGS